MKKQRYYYLLINYTSLSINLQILRGSRKETNNQEDEENSQGVERNKQLGRRKELTRYYKYIQDYEKIETLLSIN